MTGLRATGEQGAAVVTGGGRGLGREIAGKLAARGYAVCVADVDVAAAQEVAGLLGPPAWAVRLDVADAAACRQVASATVGRAGRLALWVNNAGILRTGPAWEVSDHDREAVFAVNLHGTVNGTLAALEVYRAQGRGHVLNVVSLAGLVAAPGETVYAASKHAVLAFSVGTMLDLRRTGHRDIFVSALCPDGMWTPMIENLLDDPEAALSFSGTLLRPGQVADAAMRLVDSPRPVLTVPRWRGGMVRTFAAFPRAGGLLAPVLLADARRRQRRWAGKVRSGAVGNA